MASKRVLSALNLLTSDEFISTPEWVDNAAAQELIAEYFTGGVISGDETSGDSESDDDTSTGRISLVKKPYAIVFLVTWSDEYLAPVQNESDFDDMGNDEGNHTNHKKLHTKTANKNIKLFCRFV